MCKDCTFVIGHHQPEKEDELSYKKKVRNSCLTPGKRDHKVDIICLSQKGEVDLRSKKGAHIKKVVFDIAGHPNEASIISNIKRGLSKVNKEPNPVFLRVSTDDIYHEGCFKISKISDVLNFPQQTSYVGC
jgi:hypothetical protein